MTKVSVSEAARLAGISRGHLYRGYIDPGKISVERDSEAVRIDTSELLRVFGTLTPTGEPSAGAALVPAETHLEEENTALRERLRESAEREEWHRRHADELMRTTKLLEHKSAAEKGGLSAAAALVSELRQQIAGLERQLAETRRTNHALRAQLAAARTKGFLARLFGA